MWKRNNIFLTLGVVTIMSIFISSLIMGFLYRKGIRTSIENPLFSIGLMVVSFLLSFSLLKFGDYLTHEKNKRNT